MTKTKTKLKTAKKRTAKAAITTPPPGPGEVQITIDATKKPPTRTNIKADIVGEYFALHAPYDASIAGVPRKGWDLTHLGTGMRIAHYRNHLTARWVAEQFRSLGGAPVWDFTNVKESQDRVKPIRDRVYALTNDVTAEAERKAAKATAPKTIPTGAPTSGPRTIKTVVPDCSSATKRHTWSPDATRCLVCKLPCPTRIAAALKAVATRKRNEAAASAPPPPPVAPPIQGAADRRRGKRERKAVA